MANERAPVIWAVSDGRAGMRSQALGLAEAVARLTGGRVLEKVVSVRRPFAWLPGRFWGDPLRRLAPGSAAFVPPWPAAAVLCGRLTVPFGIALADRTLTVQTQDPRADPSRFGLVVAPRHDRLSGENVVSIHGSPNRLTQARLDEDAGKLGAALPPLPRPLAAVLIGGDSKAYRLNEAAADAIGLLLARASRTHGLLVTFSRRTPREGRARIEDALSGLPAWVWDGEPIGGLANPYFGLLGLADRVLVTEESANMVTEAAFTGKPVHLLPLVGGAPKWRRFHAALEERGVLQPEASFTEAWTYAPLRETERAARAVADEMRRRGVWNEGG